MEPIQSVSSGYAAPLRASQLTGAASSDHVAATSVAQGGIAAINSTQSVTTLAITQQVDGFLGGIDPSLQNNAYLKLLIAALIMQVLLGSDGGAQQSGAGLQSLEGLTGGRNSALFVTIESSTNSVQLQQQSYRLDMNSAVQSLSQTADGAQQSGRQMDVTG